MVCGTQGWKSEKVLHSFHTCCLHFDILSALTYSEELLSLLTFTQFMQVLSLKDEQ
jgi:hypothetical protein